MKAMSKMTVIWSMLLGVMVCSCNWEPVDQGAFNAYFEGYEVGTIIPESEFEVIDRWQQVQGLTTSDDGKILKRGSSDADNMYAIADSTYQVQPTQNFELRLKMLALGEQRNDYNTDLRIGLDAQSAPTADIHMDAYIRIHRLYDRARTTQDNTNGETSDNVKFEGEPLAVGDQVFIRRTYSDLLKETKWEFGVIRTDDTQEILGEGVGFNFIGAALPKVSLALDGMRVQTLLLREDLRNGGSMLPTAPPTDTTTNSSSSGSGSGNSTPPNTPPSSSSRYVLRNPVGPNTYTFWEIFDPKDRKYNPSERKINQYFRTHIQRVADNTGGVEWSTDIAPLIPGDGQVMKAWVKLQNPTQFKAGNIRAEIEPQDITNRVGWSVYDPKVPQTRAYSFAFKLPDNFTYSTTGGGSPGNIAEEGYNWIITQWHDFSSPVTPPYAIQMRGKDLLFREKIYGNWYTIEEDVDQHFARGEWIVFLAIVKWTTANDGYFILYYDWADPANPTPTNWKEAVRRTRQRTIHPQAKRDVTAAWRIGAYMWLLNQASVNQTWWNNRAGVNRNMVMYFDQWRVMRLDDPKFQNFSEADIKRYFELRTE